MANNYDVFKGMSLEDAYKYADNKRNYAKDTVNQGVYQLNNQNIRDYYGITEDVPLSTVADYISTLETIEGKNKANAQKNALITKITNPNVSDKVKETADTVKNFSYNPNADVVYQSYADMYNRQGQSAAKQTMANLAASNMGRGSSYGSAATAQVQQAYAKQATDMIPQLAQQAYERLMANYNIDRDIENAEYERAVAGYQTLADDKTRQLTDEQLDLNNQAAETELKYLDPKLRQEYELGNITLEDARLQMELNQKYADRERQMGSYRGGGSSGGSVGTNNKRITNFLKGFNDSMKNSNYYLQGIENGTITAGDIITANDGYISWNDSNTIGGRGAWEGPLINAIANSPDLTAEDKQYLYYVLGLDTDRTYNIKDANGNITGTVTESPLAHHKYIFE